MDTKLDVVSNDCDDVGLDPTSDCMGLNVNRAFQPGFGADLFATPTSSRGFAVTGAYAYRHPAPNPTYTPY